MNWRDLIQKKFVEYSHATSGGVVTLSETGINASSLKLKEVDKLTEDNMFECCLAKCKVSG